LNNKVTNYQNKKYTGNVININIKKNFLPITINQNFLSNLFSNNKDVKKVLMTMLIKGPS